MLENRFILYISLEVFISLGHKRKNIRSSPKAFEGNQDAWSQRIK